MRGYMHVDDGDFIIYLLEGWDEKNQKWRRGSPSNPAGFDACGECWQRTGIHGTFDHDQALEGAAEMQKKYGTPFRIVRLEISQRVTVPSRKLDLSNSHRPFPNRNRFVLRAVLDLDDASLNKMLDSAIEQDRVRIRRLDKDGDPRMGRVYMKTDCLEEAVRRHIDFEVPDELRDLYGVREVMES